jgi:hypothetical protein
MLTIRCRLCRVPKPHHLEQSFFFLIHSPSQPTLVKSQSGKFNLFYTKYSIGFYKNQTSLTLTMLIEKIINIYNIKCISYENIFYYESNDLDQKF